MKLVVTVMTLLGGLCGLAASGLLMVGQLWLAFGLVIVAMVLDMLDGPLARRYRVESRLGVWLDSLADVFIYLLFPAVFWYFTFDLSLLVLVLFVGAGCFRLIRFTLQGLEEHAGKKAYAGMPVFYNQALLALSFALAMDYAVLVVLLIAAAVLAVSTIPFAKLPVRVMSLGLALYAVVVAVRLAYVG